MEKLKIIISGGGTGGHVFPAIAIADELKAQIPDCEILFVGSDNRLEVEKVPEAGYEIIGLPIRGLQRKFSFKIFDTFFRLIKSLNKSRKIIKKFKPNIVVGVGGYASAAVMRIAAKKGIPTLIQEQNSFPGITNKMLAKNSNAICVAYEKMERFFPAEIIHFTGNPIRNLNKAKETKQEALEFFNLKADKKTIFITGGSLGAKTLNNSVIQHIEAIHKAGIQIIWQTGKKHFASSKEFYNKHENKEGIFITQFIDRMDLAYKASDLVISRAGAISISELALLEKAVIFVPSPNVAEDHQTKNAEALVEINAAIMIKDIDAEKELIPKAIEIISDEEKILKFSENIAKYAKPNAAKSIVDIILEIKK
ncbi:MAG: undecaprenyldiphospho-muramoylpentapeptide beta-N-acetylglucosaminyltransferase [Bacteroidales bacterium]|nr:undecaprenyldiphospho-muramoylpentapeptide beta-N-acetylglucosaminyltransferase [Bacteroidales bacterium]